MKTRRHPVQAALLLLVSIGFLGLPPAGAVPAELADEEEGLGRMVLLLDSSGSMAEPAAGGQTKIAAARSALRTVIEGLPPEAEVGLRVFGAKVFSRTDPGSCTDSQLVVEPGTDNRDRLGAAIGAYEPYGETPIPHALQEAARDLGSEGARSIVLVSDGESTCDPDPCQVAADLQGRGIDLQIDVVGLSVSGAAREQLRCIAEEGNGTYYDADSAADIESRLTRVASRAIRPFTLSGEPIVGGPEDAPTPIEAGEYTDTLGPAGASRSYVFTRETPGTTLRVVALSQGEGVFSDGLLATLVGPTGRCDYQVANRFLDTREVMSVQTTAGVELGETSADGCDGPGDFVVTVTRSAGGESEVPIGLVVIEEPPVEDVGFVDTTGADVTAPAPGGAAQAVEGGTSFDSATEVGTGVWSSTVVPGETQLYSIPLEHGQAVKVSVDFAAETAGLAEKFGRTPPLAHLGVYSPLGAHLGYPDGAEWSEPVDGVSMMTATRAVSRAPSDIGSDQFNAGGDMTTAGDYYVSVSVERQDFTVEIPFTLNVEVVGEPADGPTYVDAPAEPGGEADESAAPAAEDDDDSSGTTAAVVAAVVIVLLLAGVVGLLGLRRRRR